MDKINKIDIVNKFIKFYNNASDGYEKLKNFLEFAQITKKDFSLYFNNLQDLELCAREINEKEFEDYKLTPKVMGKYHQRAQEVILKYKRFIITSVVVGCEVDEKMLASIDMYCRVNDAALLILIAADPSADSFKNFNGILDKKLRNKTLIVQDVRLNNNCFLSAIKLSAKHIDPTTGLDRIGCRSGSFIYASPKQRLKVVPISNSTTPHVIMTTGAITTPNYETQRYMSKRTSYIANHDHVMGGIVVEIKNEEIFHYRQIQSDDFGNIIDLGVKYSSGCYEVISPKALVLGDLHAGETDHVAYNAWMMMSKKLKPEKIIVHDVFNGYSINPHEDNQHILKSIKSEFGLLSLKSEIEALSLYLANMTEHTKEVIIVKSNHDLFLDSYLQQGKYVKDYINYKYALELALVLANDEDPLKYAVEKFLSEDVKNKIRWLKLDEDLLIDKVHCGNHGHIGPSGKRNPPISAIEKSYKYSVTAHSHAPEILRGAYRVGTTSILNPAYRHGASSWLHTSCLIYNLNQRQLINCIFGEYTTDKTK